MIAEIRAEPNWQCNMPRHASPARTCLSSGEKREREDLGAFSLLGRRVRQMTIEQLLIYHSFLEERQYDRTVAANIRGGIAAILQETSADLLRRSQQDGTLGRLRASRRVSRFLLATRSRVSSPRYDDRSNALVAVRRAFHSTLSIVRNARDPSPPTLKTPVSTHSQNPTEFSGDGGESRWPLFEGTGAGDEGGRSARRISPGDEEENLQKETQGRC